LCGVFLFLNTGKLLQLPITPATVSAGHAAGAGFKVVDIDALDRPSYDGHQNIASSFSNMALTLGFGSSNTTRGLTWKMHIWPFGRSL